ncbi:MAG TPA: transposase, partial [Opitutaceae bacterium]|nr:transposase [Opitutaceae bacterium]
GTAAAPREHAASVTPEALEQVVATGGKLPLTTLLRCRIRHFTDGAVLGSQAFVQQQLAAYRTLHHRRARTAVRPMPALTDWGGLATLRGLRKPAIS